MDDQQFFPTKTQRRILIARRLLLENKEKRTPINIQRKIDEEFEIWYAVATILGNQWKMKQQGVILT